MSKITPTLLNDTLNLMQLARETAKMQGQGAKAERLQPVVEGLRNIVSNVQATDNTNRPPSGTGGVTAQGDFQTLLKIAQNGSSNSAGSTSILTSSPLERNNIVSAMGSGGMTDVDIARQMGITRDEVRMVLSLQQRRAYGTEVEK